MQITMKRNLFLIFFLICFACGKQKQEVCILETNHGTMAFRFFEQDAPNTSAHFKQLVKEGFYDHRSFYRVVKGHVIHN